MLLGKAVGVVPFVAPVHHVSTISHGAD